MDELIVWTPEDVRPLKKKPRGRAKGWTNPKRHRPKNINKVGSIAARCRGCGTLLVMRLKWTPGPLSKFAEEVINSVKVCHGCGRKLEKPDLKKLRITLDIED